MSLATEVAAGGDGDATLQANNGFAAASLPR